MLHAHTIRRKLAVKADKVTDTLTLDAEGRYRRRVALKTDAGAEVLLDLAQATFLADGDALVLDDGNLVLVRAAAEKLLEISAASPLRLLRLAWHIGNRHTPAEITPEAIYIGEDHVLAEMARGLGGAVRAVTRPFNPEGGAYGDHGAAHGAGHSHGGHSHGGHSHGGHAQHAHDHEHKAHNQHEHGPDCDHDHDHQHGLAHEHGHGHAHDHAAHGHGHVGKKT